MYLNLSGQFRNKWASQWPHLELHEICQVSTSSVLESDRQRISRCQRHQVEIQRSYHFFGDCLQGFFSFTGCWTIHSLSRKWKTFWKMSSTWLKPKLKLSSWTQLTQMCFSCSKFLHKLKNGISIWMRICQLSKTGNWVLKGKMLVCLRKSLSDFE